jgi:hypothetical protein
MPVADMTSRAINSGKCAKSTVGLTAEAAEYVQMTVVSRCIGKGYLK